LSKRLAEPTRDGTGDSGRETHVRPPGRSQARSGPARPDRLDLVQRVRPVPIATETRPIPTRRPDRAMLRVETPSVNRPAFPASALRRWRRRDRPARRRARRSVRPARPRAPRLPKPRLPRRRR